MSLYGVPPGTDFATALVAGMEARWGSTGPETMARITLFTNTRRAKRRIEAVFQERSATLLPQIRVVGDLAEALAPEAGLARSFRLMRLVSSLIKAEPDLAPEAAAHDLALALDGLLDEIEAEGLAPDILEKPLPDGRARHWEIALRFLRLMRRFREEDGAASGPEARQRAAVLAQIALWEAAPPRAPVILAGSTGSRTPTALLMDRIAELPDGHVVLPGFDFDLDAASWSALAKAPPDHPQSGFARLFQRKKSNAGNLARWVETPPPARERNQLLSVAMRPAPVTDGWRAAVPSLVPGLGAATDGLTWLEPTEEREEAAAIALMLKDAAAAGKRAVLISPDATLSRRVALALERWGIVPDDSGGRPVLQSPPAVFLSLVADALTTPLQGAALVALLKHPLTASGGDRAAHLALARRLETRVLRGGPPEVTADMLRRFAEDAATSHPEAAAWIAWLEAALDPGAAEHLADRLMRHRAAAQRLAAGPDSNDDAASGGLWDKAAGVAVKTALDTLAIAADAAGPVTPGQYRSILAASLGGRLAPEGYLPDPRIAIWGTLEARVQTADFVVLGGLTEGVWPAAPTPDPWLNRDMRQRLGLPVPEELIGLAAHDFQTGAANAEVVFSAVKRKGGAPTVLSRWLTRFENLLRGCDAAGEAALAAMRTRGEAWCELARAADRPAAIVDAEKRPNPKPPVAARPKRIAITDIERLARDPYAFYARKILDLRPIEPLARDADPRDRGTALHRVMEEFIAATATAHGLPPDAADVLDQIATDILAREVPWKVAAAFWRGRINRIAPAFLAEEAERRKFYRPLKREVTCAWHLTGLSEPLELRGMADRIDIDPEGRLAIFDYKASINSKNQQIAFNPQLLIEAIIAERGGFDGVGKAKVVHAELLNLKDPASGVPIPVDAEALAQAETRLRDRLARYLHPMSGFPARLAVFRTGIVGDYDHLARWGEWDDGAALEGEL